MLLKLVRLACAAVGAMLAAGGACALAMGQPAGLQALVVGAVLIVGVVFERSTYKPLAARAPGGRFQPTAERFFDPATRAPVTVYADAATGERRYVRD